MILVMRLVNIIPHSKPDDCVVFNDQSASQSFGKRVQGPPGIGFTFTRDRNYDLNDKILTNVAEETVSDDAIKRHQLDTAMIDKHDNNQDIDLKYTYNVINSKQQTFNEMITIDETLVCYKDVRDVFISRKESVFPVETRLAWETIIFTLSSLQ